jgi:hypothetical protein
VKYGPAWVTRELAKLDAEWPVTLIKLENKWLRERAAMRRERFDEIHQWAIAMRAAWCARQSPKAWPKRLAPGESAYNLAAPGAWLGLDRVSR